MTILVLSVIGWSVFAGVVFYALKSHTYRWRLLAASYATREVCPEIAAKPFEAVVMLGGGWGFARYAGVRIAVCDDGLLLRLVPPLSFFVPSLFLPFEEMNVRETSWFLNAKSFAITMTRGNGIEIVIDGVVMEWIRTNTDAVAAAVTEARKS